MQRPTLKCNKVSGFSLIEALISLTIFSIGILAIANFQAVLVSESAYNKTRSEAVQYAQQKLDDLRGYYSEEEMVAKLKAQSISDGEVFPEYAFGDLADYATVQQLITANVIVSCDFTDPTAFVTVPDTIDEDPGAPGNQLLGTNASYTRQWKFCLKSPELLYTVVEVEWEDPREGTQVVSLDTSMTFKDPRNSASLDANAFVPHVPSATGRAYLGDGTVTETQLNAGTDNQDGTISIADVGDDRVLVDSTNPTTDDDGNTVYNIVLTLEDACLTEDGSCIDFVKIKGRIYRDLSANPTITLPNTFVVASDAAYCARNFDPDVTGTHSDTNPPTTATGDYQYFDYTCYLGGGWHGNIGLILSDDGNQDRVCMGDPSSPNALSDDNDGDNNWRQQELAKRRVYRGMTFIGDASTGEPLPADTIYYSQGIADATELPDPGDRDDNGDLIPNTEYRYHGHDYVLTSITGQPTGEDCTASLTRDDALLAVDVTGDGVVRHSLEFNADGDALPMDTIFYENPSDFICLNKERVAGTFKYLDTFRTGHWAQNKCPYDPSRGPAFGYYITGTVSVPDGDVLNGSEIANTVSADNCNFVTSLADMNNLTVLDVTGLQSADYVCLVYDWGDGWTGKVYVDEGFGITCPLPLEFTDLSGDSGTIFAGNDIACDTLAQPNIGGVITAYMNDLTGATVTAVRVNDTGETVTHECGEVIVTGAHNEYAEFGCTVAEETLNGGWIGTVEVSLPSGVVCNTSTGTGTNWDSNSPLSKTWDATSPLTAANIDLSTMCYGPVDTLTITGYINSDLSMEGLALPSVTATNVTAAGCTVELVSTTQARYSCPVTFDYTTGWNGSVTIDTTSAPELQCSPLSHSPGTVTGDYNIPTTTDCTVEVAGPVTLDVTVYNYADGQGWSDFPSDLAYVETLYIDASYFTYRFQTTADIAAGARWTGTIGVTPNPGKVVCEDNETPDDNPHTFTNVRPGETVSADFTLASNYASCPVP